MLIYLVISFWGVITLLYCVKFFQYGAVIPAPDITEPHKVSMDASARVTLLIPVRNEEKNLPHIQHDLSLQDYPNDLFEIIYINDHSTDSSLELIKQFSKEQSQVKNFSLPHDQQGKKCALRLGVIMATYKYVIQTDADCRLNSSFISAHVSAIKNGYQLSAGPVRYHIGTGVFSKVEALEFYSLAGITAGSILKGKPVLCNAANLSYSATLFTDAFPYLKDRRHPSGDDVFLLEYAVKKQLNIAFIQNPMAVVETRGAGNLQAFINQRIRWGSKAKYYSNPALLTLGVLVYMMNLMIVAAVAFSMFNPYFWVYTALFFFLKFLADGFYLLKYVRLMNQQSLMFYFPIMALLYPVYLIIMGCITAFTRFSWKNREY